ncbi:MAG: protealysin inhibitor emfourin [Rhodococcus sp. (in: high G+C Gram-positive bacteria)]
MVIVVVRSGGVAGMTRRGTVDTTTMGEGAGEWNQLIGAALPLFDSLPDTENAGARDRFQWRVEIGERTCVTCDSALTGPLRELAERTLKEGRQHRDHR